MNIDKDFLVTKDFLYLTLISIGLIHTVTTSATDIEAQDSDERA